MYGGSSFFLGVTKHLWALFMFFNQNTYTHNSSLDGRVGQEPPCPLLGIRRYKTQKRLRAWMLKIWAPQPITLMFASEPFHALSLILEQLQNLGNPCRCFRSCFPSIDGLIQFAFSLSDIPLIHLSFIDFHPCYRCALSNIFYQLQGLGMRAGCRAT